MWAGWVAVLAPGKSSERMGNITPDGFSVVSASALSHKKLTKMWES